MLRQGYPSVRRPLGLVLALIASAGCKSSVSSIETRTSAAVGTATFTEFSPASGAQPFNITVGPDGNLWFTELNNPKQIAKITTSGVITEFSVPTAASRPYHITAG